MSAGSFKQDGLGWRINLIRQRFGEWSEYQLSQLDTSDWDWDLAWLKSKLFWQIIRFGLWSVVAIILVWITWQLWLLFRTYWKRWQRSSDRYTSYTPAVTQPKLSSAAWVEKAQSARIEGNYRQAVFCLYQAMLQLLDERGLVAAEPSLTDQEYRRSLLQIQISPFSSYELLLLAHQRLCFSQAEADRNLWEECQQAYQRLTMSNEQ
ncbi:MAG: DUF4129 domain-containing protein [Cyanobacteria bacterium J06621_8]